MVIKNTLFVGKVFLEFPALGSTNDYALELLSKSAPNEGTVISTHHQTEGRGQIGSKWESEPGCNVALSLILYPVFLPVRRQFVLNQAIALAVSDLVASYPTGAVKVKWPNDIYIEDRKVAGILIQNTLSGSRLQSSVVGIGLNVNQKKFSPELTNPTSLCLETGEEQQLPKVVEALCTCLEQRYLQLKRGQEAGLADHYRQRLYRGGQWASYRTAAGEAFQGRITGVTPAGRLCMETVQGEQTFDLKEVRFT